MNAANIMGIPWYYLSLWGYGTAALAVVAAIATAARIVGANLAARDDADRWRRLSWVPTAALVAAIAVPLLPVLRDAPSTEIHDQEAFSAEFAEVVHPTVDAIEDGTVPAGPTARSSSRGRTPSRSADPASPWCWSWSGAATTSGPPRTTA